MRNTPDARVAARKAAPAAASLLVVSLALSSMVLGLLLLAGCGGDAKPGATTSRTLTASPTTTAPSTASPTTDPNIPLAARAHTPAGAEAFVRYFFDQVNLAWSTADPSLLPALSEPGCKTCDAYTSSVASYRTKNQHYQGEFFTVSSISSLGKGPKGEEVLVVGKQERGAIVDQAGNVVDTSVAQSGKFVVSLRWDGTGWKTVELQVKK